MKNLRKEGEQDLIKWRAKKKAMSRSAFALGEESDAGDSMNQSSVNQPGDKDMEEEED